MPPLWNPISVLDLPAHHNCVVFRTSRKHHCGVRLRKDNAALIETIVHDMAQLPPDSDAVHTLLIQLALCGLCKQFHQRRHEATITEWVDKIEFYVYMRSAFKGDGHQASVGDVDAALKALRAGTGPTSAHKSHGAEPGEAEDVDDDGLQVGLPVGNCLPKSGATSKHLLVLPVFLVVILMVVAIAGYFDSSRPLSLAFSA